MTQDKYRQDLRLLIFQNELKQVHIARELGMSKTTLNGFIRGRTILTESELKKIIDFMKAINERNLHV